MSDFNLTPEQRLHHIGPSTYRHFSRVVCEEVCHAETRFPTWPVDPVHGAAIMAEEAGEAVRAALDHVYRGGTPETLQALRREVVQTAAMCYRFLAALETEDGPDAPASS